MEPLRIARETATVRAQVEARLRGAIASGRFRAGQRLVERELCALLGVGRTSVREALQTLAAEGLITAAPHRGPVVATLDAAEARQLYEVRALLEGFAGRGCATEASAGQVAALRRAQRALEAAAREGGEALLAAKAAFYDRLLEGCGNAVVRQLLGGLHRRITLLRRTSMQQPGRLPRSLREIRRICQRIEARDPEGAEEACAAHVRNAAKAALAVLEQGDGKR